MYECMRARGYTTASTSLSRHLPNWIFPYKLTARPHFHREWRVGGSWTECVGGHRVRTINARVLRRELIGLCAPVGNRK